MIRPSCARRNHADAGRKRAVVCSRPPSVVGVGIETSGSNSSPPVDPDSVWPDGERGVADDVGRKYMYIWVVNRLGTFVGVTQRVNGIKPSVKTNQHPKPITIGSVANYLYLLSLPCPPATSQTEPRSNEPVSGLPPSPPQAPQSTVQIQRCALTQCRTPRKSPE